MWDLRSSPEFFAGPRWRWVYGVSSCGRSIWPGRRRGATGGAAGFRHQSLKLQKAAILLFNGQAGQPATASRFGRKNLSSQYRGRRCG